MKPGYKRNIRNWDLKPHLTNQINIKFYAIRINTYELLFLIDEGKKKFPYFVAEWYWRLNELPNNAKRKISRKGVTPDPREIFLDTDPATPREIEIKKIIGKCIVSMLCFPD